MPAGCRLALMVVVALLAGCSRSAPPPPPPPPSVQLTIKAGSAQNPTAEGTPSPVAVRLYLLKASGRFAAADAYGLMDRAAAMLGEDVAGTEALLVRPGETRTLTLTPSSGVRYLGSAVLFRDIDRARWRGLAPIAAQGPTELTLTIAGSDAVLAAP